MKFTIVNRYLECTLIVLNFTGAINSLPNSYWIYKYNNLTMHIPNNVFLSVGWTMVLLVITLEYRLRYCIWNNVFSYLNRQLMTCVTISWLFYVIMSSFILKYWAPCHTIDLICDNSYAQTQLNGPHTRQLVVMGNLDQWLGTAQWWGLSGVNVLSTKTLQWRHNERHGVSNHQPHVCLLNRLFRQRLKKHRSSASLDFYSG